MLVTFRSDAGGSVTMFKDDAVAILKMMGHSGTVPSAIVAKDVPGAVERLSAKVQTAKAAGQGKPEQAARAEQDSKEPPPVSLAQRAFPLLQLLSAAAAKGSNVMWEEGRPPV